jgi:long-chain acyl-CoA synthetase
MEFRSPLDMMLNWEKTQPEKVFLRQPVGAVLQEWTWRQTADEVRRMAAALDELNLPERSHIALISRNCAHWIICDLAIMMAGHVSIPLYSNLTSDSISRILKHGDVRLLFVGKTDDWSSKKHAVPAGMKCISFPFSYVEGYENWYDLIAKYPAAENATRNEKSDIATIVYSSGTTGEPKGVQHTYHNFSFTAMNAIPYLGLTGQERFFSYLPLSHIAERCLVEMGSIYSGGHVYFMESPEKFLIDLKKADPTVFLGVHRIWSKLQLGILEKIPQKKLNMLLRIPIVSSVIRKKIVKNLGLASAGNIFTGAAPTPVVLIKWFDKIGIKIQEAYAMTENCCYSHVTNNKKIKIGYVGQTLPHCDIRLDQGNEILIKHDALMVGYYKDPESTKMSFTEDGFLRTGDEGFIDTDGFLKLTGRLKDNFKTSKGKYVAPSPIEMKISKCAYVENICIVGSDLPQPIVLVTLSEIGKRMPEKELAGQLEIMISEVNQTLESFERVEKIVVLENSFTVENGLLTPSFKIKRYELEKRFASNFEIWYFQKKKVIFEWTQT